MIPRYQRIVFWVLVLGILVMIGFLARGRQKAHARLASVLDESPIAAPVDTPAEPVSVALANDANGFIVLDQRQIALPQEPAVRARVLLERLLAEYALPGSAHPLPSGAAIADVFLLDLPADQFGHTTPDTKLAVVNLRGTFANQHPSGIEAEDLTLRSIVGTLHANFSHIGQIRFLVDGEPRATLAGHADLSRPYPSIDTVDHPLHNLATDGSRQ